MKTIVYSKPNCPQCEFTKKFLTDEAIPFEARDITESDTYMEEVKSYGFKSVPVVVSEAGTWFGFRPDKLEELQEQLA